MTTPVSATSKVRTARRLAAACAVAALLAAAAPGAGAQATTAGSLEIATTSKAIPEAPELVIEDGAIRLGLEDAVAIALARNLDVAIERYARERSLYGVRSANGAFDLRAGLGFSLAENDSPSISQVEGVPVLQTDNRSVSGRLDQFTPWGGEATLLFSGIRRSTNSADVLVQPDYSATARIELFQPLLRDFGRLPATRNVLVARLSSGISRQDFERRVSEILLQVEFAYWNLVEAREQLVVARESLNLAEDLHGRNKIQVDVGTLAPIELVQSEATIALRQEDIISAEATQRDSVDELLRLLNLPDAMAEGLDLTPLTEPETTPLDIDLEEAIATAHDERPELAAQRLVIEQLQIDSKLARNQTLPRADLRAGYGSAGIGGRGLIPLPDGTVLNLDSDLTDAFQDVLDRDFTGWSLGVSFSYPLQNRTARAERVIADLAFDEGKARLSQLELQVITEVRSAARAVRTAAQQIESARATRNLQERNLDAEQKRYENGMSDSFRIAEIQNDLTEARSREVTSVTNYRKALVDYRQSIGRLLEENGVTLVGPEDEAPTKRRFSLFG